MNSSKPLQSDPKVRRRPVRQESLPPNLLDQIQAVYGVLGRYLGIKLEEFKTSFVQDVKPKSKVALWNRIAAAWDIYHQTHLGGMVLPDQKEMQMVAALVALSAGEKDLVKLPVSPTVGSQLLACYRRSSGQSS